MVAGGTSALGPEGARGDPRRPGGADAGRAGARGPAAERARGLLATEAARFDALLAPAPPAPDAAGRPARGARGDGRPRGERRARPPARRARRGGRARRRPARPGARSRRPRRRPARRRAARPRARGDRRRAGRARPARASRRSSTRSRARARRAPACAGRRRRRPPPPSGARRRPGPARLARRPLAPRARRRRPDGLVLLDLPDFDSVEIAHRVEVDRLVRLVDLLVWVVDPQKYADAALHERYLRPLAGHAAVMLVVLNQVDLLGAGAAPARADLAGCWPRRAGRRAGAGRLGAHRRGGRRAAARDRGAGAPPRRGARAAGRRRGRERRRAAAAPAAARRRGSAARDRDQLVAALAEAAGVPAVVGAVGAAHRHRGALATGRPWARGCGGCGPTRCAGCGSATPAGGSAPRCRAPRRSSARRSTRRCARSPPTPRAGCPSRGRRSPGAPRPRTRRSSPTGSTGRSPAPTCASPAALVDARRAGCSGCSPWSRWPARCGSCCSPRSATCSSTTWCPPPRSRASRSRPRCCSAASLAGCCSRCSPGSRTGSAPPAARRARAGRCTRACGRGRRARHRAARGGAGRHAALDEALDTALADGGSGAAQRARRTAAVPRAPRYLASCCAILRGPGHGRRPRSSPSWYRRSPVLLGALNPFATEERDRLESRATAVAAAAGRVPRGPRNLEQVVDVEQDAKLVPSFIKGERPVVVAAGEVDAKVDFRRSGRGRSRSRRTAGGPHHAAGRPPRAARLDLARRASIASRAGSSTAPATSDGDADESDSCCCCAGQARPGGGAEAPCSRPPSATPRGLQAARGQRVRRRACASQRARITSGAAVAAPRGAAARRPSTSTVEVVGILDTTPSACSALVRTARPRRARASARAQAARPRSRRGSRAACSATSVSWLAHFHHPVDQRPARAPRAATKTARGSTSPAASRRARPGPRPRPPAHLGDLVRITASNGVHGSCALAQQVAELARGERGLAPRRAPPGCATSMVATHRYMERVWYSVTRVRDGRPGPHPQHPRRDLRPARMVRLLLPGLAISLALGRPASVDLPDIGLGRRRPHHRAPRCRLSPQRLRTP